MIKQYFLKVLIIAVISTSFLSCSSKSKLTLNGTGEVKNVIYMIGDGMGISHVSAMMIQNQYKRSAFDRSNATGLVKTFSSNNRVTDSAAAGTALASGFKTKNGTLGIAENGDTVFSILSRAGKIGKKTGIVVTCEIEHATPAAFYAHVGSRGSMEEIAIQLSKDSIDVLIGGGYKYLNMRKDKIDLVKRMEGKSYTFFNSFDDLKKVSTGKVLALVDSVRLPYYDEGRGDFLPKATSKALEILTNNSEKSGDKGFFLMVEGSQIDFAGHKNDIKKVINEMDDFDKAIGIAFDYADAHPGTLVVVTADHETGGLSLPSGNSDFTKGESGVNFKFGSTSHTGIMVPVFAYGTGALNFTGVFDNTDLPKIISRLAGIK